MKSRLLRGALLPSRNSSLSDIYVNERRGAFPFPIQDKNEVTLPLQMWIVRLPATEITIAFRQCASLIPGPQVLAGALLGEDEAPPIGGNYELAVLMSNEVSALLLFANSEARPAFWSRGDGPGSRTGRLECADRGMR